MKLKSKDKKKAVANAHNKKQLGKIAKFEGGGQNWTNLSPTDQNAGIGGQFSAPAQTNNFTKRNSEAQVNAPLTTTATPIANLGPRGTTFDTIPTGGSSYGVTTGNVAPPVPADTTTGALNASIGGVTSILSSIPQQQVQTNQSSAKLQTLQKREKRLGAASSGLGIVSSVLPLLGPIGAIAGLVTGVAAAGTKGGEMAVHKQVNTEKNSLISKKNTRNNNAIENPFAQQTDNSLLKNLTNNPVTAQNGLRGMSKYTNGGDGQLEQYNTGLHKNMPDSFANAQLDGKPIQLQRKESIFRKKNGGDYVFTDNLMNPETGNLISEDASKIDKKVQKPFYDEASLKTKNFKMEKLANLNDKIRGGVEQKSEFPMYAKDGGRFKGRYNLPSLQKGIIGAPEITGATNYKQNLPEYKINGYNFNSQNNHNIPGSTGSAPVVKKQGNNLTPGDYAQLAGSAIAPIANIANFARKAEKVKAHLDNTQYSDPRIAKDFNPLYLAENAAAQDIDKGSLSDSVRRAARVSLASGTQRNLQDYSLAVDNQNKGLEMQRDNMLAGTNRFNANQLTNRDTAQSQTNAVRRNYLNTGLAQAGQSMVDFGKMKNQGKTNEIEYSTLQNLASNYGLDPKEYEDFLKSKGVKIKYK